MSPLLLGLALAGSAGGRAVTLATRLVEEVGPRPAGSPGALAAQEWVAREIEARGWPVARTVTGPWVTTWTCRRGERPEVVLFLAHTDSVHADVPGAHDDAAAVAVLLVAMADRMPERPHRTVCFAFTDGEELGLLGAEGFAEQVVEHGILGGRIDQVMALELLGAGALTHNGLGPAWDTARLRALLRMANAEVPWMYRGVSWAMPWMERSDHRPFADRGVPSTMLMGRPAGGMLWRYHTTSDTPASLDPSTLGAAVGVVRHTARAGLLPEPSSRPDPAVALSRWVVVPGLVLQTTQLLSGAASLWGILRTDRTAGLVFLHTAWVGACFAAGVGVAGVGRPLHAALVEPVWAAGMGAAAVGVLVWPWSASARGARGAASLGALVAFLSWPWVGSVLLAPMATASLAALLAPAGRWRLLVLPLAAWPWAHLVRPAALRELAFHHLLPASAWVWGVLFTLLALPLVATLQDRALPRRRAPWLLVALAMWSAATVWAWSSPVFDDTYFERDVRWAGRP